MKLLHIRMTLAAIIAATAIGGAFAGTPQHNPQFSTAGFFEMPGSPRKVYSMNPAWRFHKGALPGNENPGAVDFDDSRWQTVSLPHGLEYLPVEASGGVNYQGEAWYRKHFTPDASLKGKLLMLYFEAIMGKSKVWINGTLVAEHFGGYLPVIAFIEKHIRWGEDNVITVWADNSDDPSYPPGKAQNVLDFVYFGGIYRDAWLVAFNEVHITDPNFENAVAGGGLVVNFPAVSKQSASVNLKLHIRNSSGKAFSGKVVFELQGKDGKTFSQATPVSIAQGEASTGETTFNIPDPDLWTPDTPNLYWLNVKVCDTDGAIIDSYRQRIGIRSIEFRGLGGLYLNGEPYPRPLIGANRHQDFAIVGNAMSNSLHWRDAAKLRGAGMEVIRSHYPQDPAFMDACDELGLLCISSTPGWQFWNDAPVFAQRVHDDIRNMVRRDRNRASLFLWEPILNETHYPASFAKEAERITREEFPYKNNYAACDRIAAGSEYFPVNYAHPSDVMRNKQTYEAGGKSYFTREWGDNVDTWSAHNSTSRVSRGWGENPMLIQAQGYADFGRGLTSLRDFYKAHPAVAGGSFWHSFDHQRGYHNDPFFGGIMDAFRQPKYSYHMFASQRSPEPNPNLRAESGPMIHIAHEMTPFSGKDVTVYTNCDEVRLTVFKDGKVHTQKQSRHQKNNIPSPIMTFANAYDFMADKALARAQKEQDVYMLAEGIIGGKVVAASKRAPARRPAHLRLTADTQNTPLTADGSDMVVVVASMVDQYGEVKRLNNSDITFEVEGEGELVGGDLATNRTRRLEWGEAPVLIRSTLNPGKITIRASLVAPGPERPASGQLTIESKPAATHSLYSPKDAAALGKTRHEPTNTKPDSPSRAPDVNETETKKKEQRQVEQQQTFFGEQS